MKTRRFIFIGIFLLWLPAAAFAQGLTLKECIHTFNESGVKPNSTGWAYWFIPSGGIADTLSVKMSMVDKGTKTHDPHKHFEDELFFMVEGESIVHVNGEEQLLRPGDAFYAPGNSSHNIRRADTNKRIRYVMFKREFRGRAAAPYLPGKEDYKMADCYTPFDKAALKKKGKTEKLCYLSTEMSDGGLNVHLQKTSRKHQVKKAGKQAVYLLMEGEASVSLNGEECRLSPLSTVYVPENASFSIKPSGKDSISYLVVHTR